MNDEQLSLLVLPDCFARSTLWFDGAYFDVLSEIWIHLYNKKHLNTSSDSYIKRFRNLGTRYLWFRYIVYFSKEIFEINRSVFDRLTSLNM